MTWLSRSRELGSSSVSASKQPSIVAALPGILVAPTPQGARCAGWIEAGF
jgi:hypothetical protein